MAVILFYIMGVTVTLLLLLLFNNHVCLTFSLFCEQHMVLSIFCDSHTTFKIKDKIL